MRPASPSSLPPLSDEILTTREVAARLAVSDATVKRWADDDLLPCYKTPGGHRKFKLSDVQGFIQSHRFQIPPPAVPLDSARELQPELLRLALAGDGAALVRLVTGAREAGVALEELFDEALAPALCEVGDRWACSELTAAREHVASQAVCDLLGQLLVRVVPPPARGTAVVGCVAGERHDIGSRMAALLLREAGFRVLHTGADTPLGEMLRLAQESDARLVAFSLSRVAPALGSGLEALGPFAAWAASCGARLVAGGGGFDYVPHLPPAFQRLPDMRAFARLLAELAPAP